MTVTLTVPVPPGAVTVSVWPALLTTMLEPAFEPKNTENAPVRLVPVRVTVLPPAVDPAGGVIPESVAVPP